MIIAIAIISGLAFCFFTYYLKVYSHSASDEEVLTFLASLVLIVILVLACWYLTWIAGVTSLCMGIILIILARRLR